MPPNKNKVSIMESGPPSLIELLSAAQLTEYAGPIQSQLKVLNSEHLRHVTDKDLSGIGMSKPEIRRFWEQYHRAFPSNGMFSRFKKRVLSKVTSSDSALKKGVTNQSRAGSKEASVPPANESSEQHIIPASQITLCKQIGSGEFGCVWQAVWTHNTQQVQVAVKVVDSVKMQTSPMDFIGEAAILHKVHHENIVRMLGVVLETKTIMLVSELAPLHSLATCLRDIKLRASFPVQLLCDFAEQIADGMYYLECNRYIHRDLATRNILVFNAQLVKISDFGLSKCLRNDEDYYRKEFTESLRLPLAWCAPECINHLKFTTASDVWAYAVTLWEMFTYGMMPWQGMTGSQIRDTIDEPAFGRLEVPDCCPHEHYTLMLACWAHSPAQRPKFAQIIHTLKDIRPERVRAVEACSDGIADHLQYTKGTLITVLNKTPREYPDGYYWKGVLMEGRTGLFLPSTTVAYLGADLPKLPQGARQFTNQTLAAVPVPVKQTNKKPAAKLVISAPVGNVTHTAHLGINGQSFGVPGMTEATVDDEQTTPAESSKSSPEPVHSPSSVSVSVTQPIEHDHDVDDAPAHVAPSIVTSRPKRAGTLLDEMFEALQIDAKDNETARNRLSAGRHTSNQHSPLDRASSTSSSTGVRPCSFSENRKLNQLEAAALRLSDKSLNREAERAEAANKRLAGVDDNQSPSSTVLQHIKALRQRSVPDSSASGADRPDQLGVTSQTRTVNGSARVVSSEWTPEAEDAYKELVLCGKALATHSSSTAGTPSPTSSQAHSPRPSMQPPPPPTSLPPALSPNGSVSASPTTPIKQPASPITSAEAESTSLWDEQDTNPLRQIRQDATDGVALKFRPGGSFRQQNRKPVPSPSAAPIVPPKPVRSVAVPVPVNVPNGIGHPKDIDIALGTPKLKRQAPSAPVSVRGTPPPVAPKPKFKNDAAPPHPLIRRDAPVAESVDCDTEHAISHVYGDKYELLNFVLGPLSEQAQHEQLNTPPC